MADHRDIIDKLGGIRPLARKLGHESHTKVQGWRDRNSIPIEHWPEILKIEKEDGSTFATDDLLPAELRSVA
jgi:hypothetical protein